MASSGGSRVGSSSLGEWKAITLETGISNKGTPYSNAECSLGSNGIVYLRGVIKSSGAVSKEAAIAKLPSGYHPTKQQLIDANIGGVIGDFIINTEGKIEISLAVTLETVFSFDNKLFPLV
jgi:hypothetical protein